MLLVVLARVGDSDGSTVLRWGERGVRCRCGKDGGDEERDGSEEVGEEHGDVKGEDLGREVILYHKGSCAKRGA